MTNPSTAASWILQTTSLALFTILEMRLVHELEFRHYVTEAACAPYFDQLKQK